MLPQPSPSPISREQYHKLAATLHNAQGLSGMKAIMIASAVAGEGKTLTAANLALAFSESYQRRVLLVDADLRRPSLHTLFTLDQVNGPALRQVTPRLGILTSGRPTAAPIAELASERMRHVLDEARQAYDWIIVDTPPLTLLADASLLVSMVDGAVLVVKAASTPVDLVKRAMQVIDKDKTLGVVLNASRRSPHAGYGDVEYYQRLAAATGAGEGVTR
jgi:protein-tyrosine kinase